MKQRYLPLFCAGRPVKYKDDSGEDSDGSGLSAPFPIATEVDLELNLDKAKRSGFDLFVVGFFDPLLRSDGDHQIISCPIIKIDTCETFKLKFLYVEPFDILFKEKEVSADASKSSDEKSE